MTRFNPSPEDLKRLPGLYRKWELPDVLQAHCLYQIEDAGEDAGGTPLLAIFGDFAATPTEPSQPVQHLNEKELAKRWRLSPRSLQRWRHQRIGPPFLKIFSRVIYPLDGIEAVERQGRAESVVLGHRRAANARRPSGAVAGCSLSVEGDQK
ncbi:hypothetical protein [Mesorhizobium sp. IMUNJ 23232]|uniref:hypothetical protein n=1 Tax=Mesorhizobium sp. IMUNJ 23232 TaxID=3376064 RepID=UPI0037A5528D